MLCSKTVRLSPGMKGGRKETGGAAGTEFHEASMEKERCTQERGGEARFLITGRKDSKNTGMLYTGHQGSWVSPGPKPSMHMTNLDPERPMMRKLMDSMLSVSLHALTTQ